MTGMDESKGEWRFRIKEPSDFDRKSIRTKALPSKSKAINILVGCPKGHYHPNIMFKGKRGKCDVGTQTQAYRFKKNKFSRSHAEGWVRRNVCPRNPKVCRSL